MIEDIVIAERQRADAIAYEYLSKGYEVSKEVSLDFFPDFRVDMLVRKGDELKVVEVKSSTSLARDPKINELAEILYSKPGWSFELDLVAEREKLDSFESACPFEREDVLRRIAEAETILKSGVIDAAFLLAWSASEATVRMLLKEEGMLIDRITNSAYTLGRAVSEGVISWDDYNYLNESMKYRNAVVHGFRIEESAGELQVQGLIETTNQLLQSLEVDGKDITQAEKER